MKKKDITAVRQTDTADLLKQAFDIRKQLAQSNVQRFTKPEKNVRGRKMLRQKLSRILTALREKEKNHGA